VRKADNLPPSCAVVTKSGNLNFLKPSGPFWACKGTALPFLSVLSKLQYCAARPLELESLRSFETSETARRMTHRHTPEELNIQQSRCAIIKHPVTQYRSYMLRNECRYVRTQMGRPIRTPRPSRGIILKCMLKKYCVKVRTEFEWSRIGLTADSCEH
jgi:hypothetical protein